MPNGNKLIIITTSSITMNIALKGQLKFLSRHLNVIGVTDNQKNDIANISIREGVPVIPIGMKRNISPWKDCVTLIKLVRLLAKEKPLIVHTHTPKAGLLGMMAATITRTPFRIHTVAGMPQMEAKGLKKRVLTLTEKLTYRLAHKVFPNSKGLYEYIVNNNFISPKKLQIVGHGTSNGVDTHFFSRKAMETTYNRETLRKERFNLEKEHFVFIFVGRLAVDKGVKEMIDAFETLHKTQPQVRLLMIGPLEKEYGVLTEEIVNRIESHPAIHWPGRMEDIRPALFCADCFVFPSYREGFPVVLLESGVMKVPVIASDIPGNNDLITDQKNGLLFKPKSVESLVSTMNTIINSPENRLQQFSETLYKDIVEKYSDEYVYNQLVKCYKDIIK